MVPEVAYTQQHFPRLQSPLQRAESKTPHADSLQRNGRRMVVAGYAVTIVSVVLYCLACFSGGFSADMGDLLLQNAVPFARGTLALLGVGTFIWLVGSFAYLRGAMEIDGAQANAAAP